MSIRTRLDDARCLYKAGRKDGAFLSILIAIAATSRKRYPRDAGHSDRKAYETFLHDEMSTITGALNLNVKFRNELRPLQEVLYRFVRCQLAHEASMPEDFVIAEDKGFKVTVDDDRATFSDGLLKNLFNVVAKAPENKDDFSDVFDVSSA